MGSKKQIRVGRQARGAQNTLGSNKAYVSSGRKLVQHFNTGCSQPVLVYQVGHNKAAQLGGSEQQRFIISQFQRPELQSQGVASATIPLKVLGKKCPRPLSQIQQFLCLWKLNSSISPEFSLCICLSPHMAFFLSGYQPYWFRYLLVPV